MLLLTANIFQPLIDVFESVLKFFHNSGGISWGWSIVLLTIAVRAVLVPLTFRQIKSMVRMQGLAPQMKEIQQKYKQDKARQQEEIMKFYRENNVNPLGSCLPMVLQLPVFISLYYMLRESLRQDICPGVQAAFRRTYAAHHHISLAAAHGQTTSCGAHGGSSFLFVHDLTAQATGVELGVLIVLYVGSQLGSSLLMSAQSMDPTQRRIMMFMPLIFVLFVIRFPAGLLVYWITTNLWTVAQQYTVRRVVGPVQAVTAAAAGGAAGAAAAGSSPPTAGGGGFGGRMRERLAQAQADAAAARTAKTQASTTNGDDTGTAAPSRPAGRGGTRRAIGSGSGGNGNGNGNGSNGGSDARPAAGAGARSGGGAPPPRPPRKKKKRSGRRR
jgi:YidC/Oxa1 family membrane protein insertase